MAAGDTRKLTFGFVRTILTARHHIEKNEQTNMVYYNSL